MLRTEGSGTQDRGMRLAVATGTVVFVVVVAAASCKARETVESRKAQAAAATTAPAVAAAPQAEAVAAPKPEEVAAARADGGTPGDGLGLAHEDVGDVNHFEKAGTLRELGDEKGWQAELRKALFHTPEDASILWLVARGTKDAVAEQALAKLTELTPWDAEPARELARRRLDRGDAAGALEAATEAVKRDGKSWEAHHLQGRALMGLNRLSAAIRAYRRATGLAGASGFAWNNLGYALLLANKPEDAVEALETALEKGPVTPYMLNNLGLAHEKLGHLDDAELAFQSAVDIQPGYVKAIVNLGRITDAKKVLAEQPSLTPPEEKQPELVPGG